jgi:hypothetical protein
LRRSRGIKGGYSEGRVRGSKKVGGSVRGLRRSGYQGYSKGRSLRFKEVKDRRFRKGFEEVKGIEGGYSKGRGFYKGLYSRL